MKRKCTLFYDVRFGGADEAQWPRVWKALTSVSSDCTKLGMVAHFCNPSSGGWGGNVEVGEAYIQGHLSYLENLKLCVTMFFILFCFITK